MHYSPAARATGFSDAADFSLQCVRVSQHAGSQLKFDFNASIISREDDSDRLLCLMLQDLFMDTDRERLKSSV